MDPWLLAQLVCPVDRGPLSLRENELACASGHSYAVIDGIPVMLAPDAQPIHGYLEESLEAVRRVRAGQPLGWEAELTRQRAAEGDRVDPWVQDEIVRTCGFLYVHLQQGLPRYPIPALRLPPGNGQCLLDVGCNWGRWTIAADRAGYRAVGIDPSLRALQAAQGVARQCGASPRYVVGDARHLPFADDAFDVGFSYSVFQHFPQDALVLALQQLARVVRPEGSCTVQMANRYGLRQIHHELRGRARPKLPFEVRRYSPKELREIFEACIGPSTFDVDGFFTLNPQPADLDVLPPRMGLVVRVSEALRRASGLIPDLWHVADSVYITGRPKR